MLVEFLRDYGRHVKKGDRHEVPDNSGEYLIAAGAAVEVKPAEDDTAEYPAVADGEQD